MCRVEGLPYVQVMGVRRVFCSTQFLIFKGYIMAISKGTVGAINELRACVYLLGLGWSVFRAYSPNSAADLLISKGRRTVLRVQVKSSLNGQWTNLRVGNNDLLCIVSDGEIRLRAASKRIARMFPVCGLVRKPKPRPQNSH